MRRVCSFPFPFACSSISPRLAAHSSNANRAKIGRRLGASAPVAHCRRRPTAPEAERGQRPDGRSAEPHHLSAIANDPRAVAVNLYRMPRSALHVAQHRLGK